MGGKIKYRLNYPMIGHDKHIESIDIKCMSIKCSSLYIVVSLKKLDRKFR